MLLQKRELSRRTYFLFVCFLFLARILLTIPQYMVIQPNQSGLDDALMLRAAQSITEGNWMGPYSWFAAGKHMFFAVWLAFLHAFHIPYLVGGQLLYSLAALSALGALSPVFCRRESRLLFFFILAYNPVSWASFTLRVYRDNIFPALCLFFFSGMLGYLLRQDTSCLRSFFWAVLSGFALGLACLTREDGIWLLPFALAATFFDWIVIFLKKQSKKRKWQRFLFSLLPFVLCLLCLFVYSFVNFQVYGRFMVSDFTSKEFNDAYGAFTRIHVEKTDSRIPVTYEERCRLYEVCPMAAELGKELETPHYYNGFGNAETREFNAGGLYWAIRQAVDTLGYYETPATAKAYYESLADAINKVCDEGKIPCGPKRSGTMTPFRPAYTPAILQEMGNSFRMLLFFEDTLPYENRLSNGTPEEQQVWVDYLYTECTRFAKEGSDIPYLNLYQKLAAMVLSVITWIFRLLLFPALFLAFWQLGRECRQIFSSWKQKQQAKNLLPAVLLFGLFLCVILRVAMISYVEAVSFQIGTYLMYLSSAMIPLLLFVGWGSLLCLERIWRKKITICIFLSNKYKLLVIFPSAFPKRTSKAMETINQACCLCIADSRFFILSEFPVPIITGYTMSFSFQSYFMCFMFLRTEHSFSLVTYFFYASLPYYRLSICKV